MEAERLPVTQPQKPQSITSVTFYLSSKSLRQTQKQGKKNLTPPPGGIQDHILEENMVHKISLQFSLEIQSAAEV